MRDREMLCSHCYLNLLSGKGIKAKDVQTYFIRLVLCPDPWHNRKSTAHAHTCLPNTTDTFFHNIKFPPQNGSFVLTGQHMQPEIDSGSFYINFHLQQQQKQVTWACSQISIIFEPSTSSAQPPHIWIMHQVASQRVDTSLIGMLVGICPLTEYRKSDRT